MITIEAHKNSVNTREQYGSSIIIHYSNVAPWVRWGVGEVGINVGVLCGRAGGVGWGGSGDVSAV